MSNAGNFEPIGSKPGDEYNPPTFKGTYDGQGNAITGLTVNTTSPYAGLFGFFEGTVVRNVTMVNPNIKSSNSGVYNKYAGGIAGCLHYGTIENCNVINPTLNAGTYKSNKGAISGGLTSAGATVSNCYYHTMTDYEAGTGVGTISNTYRTYTLTLGDGITTSTAPVFTYGGTVYYAGTITLDAAPTGWNYAYSVNGSTISGNTFNISADATVAVTRTPIVYTITYNLDGGTNASGNPATYTIQSAAITLSTPTRTGYDFGGWYANSGLTGDQVTTIASGSTGNVELWAKWTPTPYTITYNLDGGTNHGGNPTAYTVESAAIALGAATKTGYTFGGWYQNADFSGDAVTTIATGSTGDKTLWAKWTANTYAVAFDGNGATGGTMANEIFDYDEAKALTACAYTRTGYHFTGWNTEADGSGTAYADGETVQNITAVHNATVKLYAQWEANTYTVHFEPVIPVFGTMADMTLTYDQEATALTKNTFYTTTGEWLRWNTEADGSGTSYEDQQEVQNLTAENGGTVTLYAQWHLQHRFNYNNSIFRCYNTSNANEVYWAYEGEKVKVEVIDGTSEYTIYVTGEDGTDIEFDTKSNTFTMPDQEVYITSTSLKKMAYTSIYLDNFESWEDVVYLYDADHPTVTPTVVVKDGEETTLTEGTDYTLAITNNTGNPTQMVTATVTVTGMGDYVGTNTKEFRITPFNIANCEIKGTLEAYNDGYGVYYPLCNNVQVWNGETQLELYTDYEIEIVYPESGTFEIGQTYNATVKGMGDWGGTKTFTFTMTELMHTVVFDANGGSGTMAGGTIGNSDLIYYLPVCTFTPPYGKAFDHWVASCEPDAEKQPGQYFTAPYIYNESDVQTITVTAYWKDAITLLDNDSAQPEGSKNADIIAADNSGNAQTVVLSGRTLYKDGDWNTLCLPFNLGNSEAEEGHHFDGTQLEGATVMTLASTGLEDGTLTMTFADATTIEAGKPYIVKWTTTGDNIVNPVFSNVLISTANANVPTDYADFCGTYNYMGFNTEDKSILFLGQQNTLYYPQAGASIGACRAYFQLKGITAGQVNSTRMFFGDDETGISEKVIVKSEKFATASGWYTLDGRKLDGRPTKKGLYIYGGRTVVIK